MEELGRKIKNLARRKRCVILAHNYQVPEIQDVADFVGDSLDLCRKAADTDAKMILFCGVDFMAETAAILNPDKKVIVPDSTATCPMAAQLRPNIVRDARNIWWPGTPVVLYINTLASAKAEADAICTSANAPKIIEAFNYVGDVTFGPDENLARYVERELEDVILHVIPPGGSCLVHTRITFDKISKLMEEHPKAVVMVHPECPPDVQELADHVLGTNGMVKKAKELEAKEFIIGTEEGLGHRLRKECPGKRFYFPPDAICVNMKKNTLQKAYDALVREGPVVKVPEDVAKRARKAIEMMLELG